MGVVPSRRRSRSRIVRPSTPVSGPSRAVEALEGRVLFATFTWDGGGADANWSTAANWLGDAAPATDGSADLVFPAAAPRTDNVNDFAPGAAFASVAFTGTGYSLTGNAVALGAGGVTDSSPGGGIGAGNSFGLDAAIAGSTTIAAVEDAASLVIAGAISGAGGSVTRTGGGSVVFDAAGTYGGGTTLLGGNTFANNLGGSAFGTGPVTNTGGTLRGSGGFGGALANNAGLAPGGTVGVPGALSTGALDFGAGGSFGFNVTGADPGTGYDQLVVTGAVDLGTGTPFNEAGSTFEPAGGELLFVIVNDGADPVTGGFAGLEDPGATVDINGFTYEISYAGDAAANAFTGGNDVVLRAASTGAPPVNAVPGAQATDEDAPLVFSAAAGNAITVAHGGNVSVSVSVPNGSGTVALAPEAVLPDAAAGENVVTVSGPVTDVNAALDGLRVTPAANSTAGVTLTVASADGSLTDTDTVAISVNAVNDAPVLTVPATQVIPQDGSVVFGSAGGNRITVADVDAAGDDVTVTLSASNGTFSLASTSGVVLGGAADAVDETNLTLTGPVSAVNAALNDLTFRPPAGFFGLAGLSVGVSDGGHNGAGGPAGDAETVTIAVSPPRAIEFAAAAYAVAEGAGTLTLTVTRAGDGAGGATVDFEVVPSTPDIPDTGGLPAAGLATPGSDFTAASGTLTFADGETTKTLTVAVADDALDEDDETFEVVLSNPTGAGALGVVARIAVVTIADDDPLPSLSVGDATATEGGVATFAVTLSAASGRAVTVDFTTGDGTATGGADFTSASGTLTFAPGETAKAVAVTTLTDLATEPAETFTVTLASAASATIADGVGGGTVDDLPNASPVAATDVVLLAPGQANATVDVLANDTDADGDALVVGDVSAPAHGTAVRNADNTVTYTPAPGYGGADAFTYAVSDGKGGVASGTVNLTVTGNGVVVNPADPRKQDLFFAGTAGDDQVQLVRVGRQVRVLLGGQDQGTFAATGTVVISGGGGNDTLTIGRLKNPVVFNGGDGDDALTGGGRGDVLVGGPGADTLNAGGGRDVVIGGDGADSIRGLGGNDLLIAGTTAYDADTAANRAALNDLLAALAARGKYAAKLAAFTGAAGVGPSGARLAPGATLFDDADPDALDGGGAQDFFAADTDGPAVDLLTKKARNESVIEL